MKFAAIAIAATLATAPAFAADVTLFGITLGRPLNLPDCPLNTQGGVDDEAVTKLCARAWPESGPARTYDIGIPASARPDYLASRQIAVEVMDGTVQWIDIITNGAQNQAKVLSQLIDKFGKPNSFAQQPWSNSLGAKLSALKARWTFGDQAVELDGFGLSGKLDRGVAQAYTKKWIDLQTTASKSEPHL